MLGEDFKGAVARCWAMREDAAQRAHDRGSTDPGLRAGVTSGKHLDPLADLVESVLLDAGLPESSIRRDRGVELPGYYRPEKKWDVVAIHDGTVVVAVEFKSILGSYGNNWNNRVEEALGNATDLLEAAEKGLLGVKPPWLGYVFLMQDEPASRSAVRVRQTNFPVDEAFRNSSYQDRAQLMCRRLVLKRLYNAAWFAVGNGGHTPESITEPANDLSWAKFEAALRGRVGETLA
jgi:hypothetical protein